MGVVGVFGFTWCCPLVDTMAQEFSIWFSTVITLDSVHLIQLELR